MHTNFSMRPDIGLCVLLVFLIPALTGCGGGKETADAAAAAASEDLVAAMRGVESTTSANSPEDTPQSPEGDKRRLALERARQKMLAERPAVEHPRSDVVEEQIAALDAGTAVDKPSGSPGQARQKPVNEKDQLAMERAKVKLLRRQLAAAHSRPAAGQNGEAAADAGAPTEEEMRRAFTDRFDRINKRLAANAKMARNHTYDKHNFMSMMNALGGAVLGKGQFKVLAFRKIGASKAVGRAGYNCTFAARITVEGGSRFARQQGAFLRRYSGQIQHGRFYHLNNTWIYEPIKSD